MSYYTYKSRLTLLLSLFCFALEVTSQTVASYGFSQSSGTFTALTGGTVLGTTTNDDGSFTAQAIGFSFVYNGTTYTQMSVNSNGFIAMGTTIASSYVALSTGGTNNVISAFNRDIQAQTGAELSIQTIGTAPNRTCVIQWLNYKKFGTNGTGDSYNFQIRLNEASNIIDVVYGSFVNNANTTTVQVGLRGATNADFNNRTSTSNWTATTAGATNAANIAVSSTILPPSGLTFTWTPPVLCSGAPTAGTTVSSVSSACNGVNFTLSLNGASVATGLSYQWQSSSDGITFNNIAAATSATLTVNQSSATYYQAIVTCTSSGLTATSTPLQVNMNAFYNCYCTAPNSGTACVTNVTINTLNNTTAGCSTGNYSQQSATTNLFLGSGYTLSLTTNATAITSVWFDWNHSGVFEPTEWYQPFTTGTTGSITVTIPVTALTGITGMRVRSRSSGNTNGANDACTSMASGETEDYIVNVVPLPPDPPTPVQDPASPTCIAGTDLSVPGSPASGDVWYWQTSATGTSTANPVSGPYTVYLNGTYYVRTYNSTNNVWSLGSSSITVNNIPLAATPPTPVAAASPACLNTTISVPAPATGIAYYWQGTNSSGTSNLMNATAPYSINSTGTYYISAYDSATSCWSNTNNVSVVIDTYIPAPPVVSNDSILICEGSASAMMNANAPSGSGIVSASFGNALVSTGTGASTYTVSVGAVPAGATITGTQLLVFGATAVSPSYRSEIRVALSGATTLAATQLSTQASAGVITPNPIITIPNLPASGGSVTLSLTETFNDGGNDATFDSVRLVVMYSLPVTTLNWWNSLTGGTVQGAGSSLEAIGTAFLPDSNTPGTYTFYAAANSGSCSSNRVAVNVFVNALPALVLSDTAVCSGQPAVLNAQNAGSTYLWNTAATSQSISTTTGGLFYVDITTAEGCMVRDSMNLIINNPPVVDLGSDIGFCSGDSILIDAANTGFNFLWNDSSTAQTITTGSAGTYYVTVTNPLTLCFESDSIVITVNPLPTVNLGIDTAICIGDSISLNAGNPGAMYSWSTGSTNQVINVNNPSTYFVYVSDPATGCYKSDTIMISQNMLPIVNIGGDTAICNGDVFLLDAGIPGSAYLWNDSSTAQTLNVSNAGNYYVDVTDVNGCKASDSINVLVNAVPVVNLGADTTQCSGSVILDAGNSGSSYSWNNSSTNQTLTATTSGIYYVAVANSNSCTSTDSITVTINPLPVLDLGNDTTQCGGSITFDAGNPGSLYSWYNNTNAQTLTVYSSSTVSVTVTNPLTGCISKDTVNVVFNQYPVVNLGNDISQCAGTVTLNAGNFGAAFLWNTSAVTPAITVSNSGLYHVDVTNAGCTSSDTIMVTINPLPAIGFPAIATLCAQGSAIILNASPAGGIFSGGTEVSGITFDPGVAGPGSHPVLYTFTDANSCSNSFTQLINVNDCTGIEETENASSVEVYPNPSAGMFNISFVNVQFTDLLINVTDIQGKEVFTFREKNITGSYNKQINLEGLQKGFYSLRLTDGNEMIIRKLIIN
ncbi:MAG: hypothetical protein K0Q95_2053 [Bacteroidota bacterium]|jgi:hypothetical protein|nr:hypothetical protein [Bacteroidota bacterium]